MAEEKQQQQQFKGKIKESSKFKLGHRIDKNITEEREYEQVILDLARVTRVTKGGKRMRFRAAVVVGDKKGRVGIGVAKGADVALAVSKSTRQAKKNFIRVIKEKATIPHWIKIKEGAAKILLKPAPPGSGIMAGGAMRVVLELSGIQDVVGKMLGANNKINNARATIKALSLLKPRK